MPNTPTVDVDAFAGEIGLPRTLQKEIPGLRAAIHHLQSASVNVLEAPKQTRWMTPQFAAFTMSAYPVICAQ